MPMKSNKRRFKIYWYTAFGFPVTVLMLSLWGSQNPNPFYWLWIIIISLVFTDITAGLMWQFFESKGKE